MPRHSIANPFAIRLRHRYWRNDRRRFQRDERAVTAVEYGVLAALIGLAIIAAVNATGQALNTTLYGQIVTALASMTK